MIGPDILNVADEPVEEAPDAVAYLEPDQVQEVYRAYLFSAEAHEGQHRCPASPTSTIPSRWRSILAEMHMDHQSIMAAILHDVIEDTQTAQGAGCRAVRRGGGRPGRRGVSKLTQIKFSSKAEAQAENFRKMMLAMVQDIRVILIKLADRLHNMRTLGVMRPDKRAASPARRWRSTPPSPTAWA
jgi:GTP diphosphokinase / guanosine-3',5'-bis(diphosphate) 3'-diphosphatase